jgi:hypothetical protein
MAGPVYIDTFRKIQLEPDGVTLTADAINDTLTITRGDGVAFNANESTDSFEIDVNYQLYSPVGTTEIRLQDVNANNTGVRLTAGSNISIARNSNSEITITSTVGGTSKSISNASQTNPVVITTTNAHSFTESIAVTITDVTGMTELNGNEYYMDILTGTTFALYEDADLTTPVNGTGFTPYSTGGVATAEYGAPQTLTQLSDVDFVSNPPVNGSYLQYNGSYWGIGTTLSGDFIGSVFADDSTLLVDGVNGSIPAANLTGALPAIDGSALTGLVAAFSDLTGTPTTLAGYGITDAATSAQGAIAESALQQGDMLIGDLKGSVFADDSTLLIDGINGTIPAENISGVKAAQWDLAYSWGNHSLAGYLTSTPSLNEVLTINNTSATGIDVGNSTIGALTITGTTLDTTDSSPLVITPSVTFDTEITVSDVVPSLNTAIDLGSSSLRYREVHSQTINTVDPTQAGLLGDGRVRTNRLYFGDESYTNYLYAGNTSSFSWGPGYMDPGNIFHNRTTTYARWKSTGQLVYNHTNPNGTVDVDFLLSDTHYFFQPTGALTVNFINIPTGGSRMYNMRIYIYQAGTAYIPTSVEVNGVAETIDWQNGITPTGTAGNIDFVQFLVWSFGSGNFSVLGQANSYS